MNINYNGEPNTIQRLVYQAARTSTPTEWRELNNLAHNVLESNQNDSEISLLVNTICIATHKVVSVLSRASEILNDK